MAKITYEKAREDHEYLWSIAPADDMTGAYVDQEDLAKLLKMPTKAIARDCYVAQIDHWFSCGPDPCNLPSADPQYWIDCDAFVKDIAIRHGFAEDGTL